MDLKGEHGRRPRNRVTGSRHRGHTCAPAVPSAPGEATHARVWPLVSTGTPPAGAVPAGTTPDTVYAGYAPLH